MKMCVQSANKKKRSGTHATFFYPAVEKKKILLSDIGLYLKFNLHPLNLNELFTFVFIACIFLP